MQQHTDNVWEALDRRYCEPVAIALARAADGRVNPITLGWHMVTSFDPPMVAISVGQGRYSLEVIRHAGEFVLSFPSEQMDDLALYCGSHSGRDSDKLAETEARTQPAREVGALLLSDAVANLECRVVSEHATGDHVIFVGQVVAGHVNSEADARRLYTKSEGRLGGVQ